MFTSLAFLLAFLPTVFALSALARRSQSGHAGSVIVLLAASLALYAAIDPQALPVLLVSIAANLAAGERILSAKTGRERRAWLLAGLAFNLLCLGLFKYAGFVTSVIRDAGGIDLPDPGLPLPTGISFYTFTQIAFLCNAYWRRLERLHNPWEFGLLVSYFPHLVAGPVLYHGTMIPQFRSRRFLACDATDMFCGAAPFMIGLAKKLMIADQLALARSTPPS
jgi:alginate O-acetyltransferase complex protein AlgI